MYLLLLKFASLQVLFHQHFFMYATYAFAIACGVKVIISLGKNNVLFCRLVVLALGAATVWYFQPIPTLFLFLLLIASHFIGSFWMKTAPGIIKFTVGFLLFLHLYVALGITGSPKVAFVGVFILSTLVVCTFFLKKVRNYSQIGYILDRVYAVLLSLTLLEVFLLLTAFIYGSFPQSGLSWDSVYANLYNARWYVETNAFQPLEESISSLFPQHAILYYSLFYAMGGFRVLQVAYLLPLILLFFTLKTWIKQCGISMWYRILIQLLLFVAIVIAQAASGYYDLFMTSLLTLGLFGMVYVKDLSFEKRVIIASLCLGVAAASKFFALVFAPFLCLVVLVHYFRIKTKKNNEFHHLALMGVAIGLMSIPLSFWMIRSYLYTGSPVFPFFQNLFPTADYWSGGSVEQNPMTQTAISTADWIKGGVFLYPILTYFRTEFYLEGTRGYPGIIYIVLLPAQIFLLILSIYHVLVKKSKESDWIFLCLFSAFFAVGVVARYYRYVWPYQFLFALITFIYGWQYVKRIKIPIAMMFAIVFFLYAIHAVDLAESFRYVPTPYAAHIFHPEALTTEKSNTLFAQMNVLSYEKPVLDASQYWLPRVYFPQRTYMCNWYWIGGDKKVKNLLSDEQQASIFLDQFSYIIVSSDLSFTGNYCTNIVKMSTRLHQVAQDEYRVLFKVK